MYASCSCAEVGAYERARDRDSTLSRADVLLWIRGQQPCPGGRSREGGPAPAGDERRPAERPCRKVISLEGKTDTRLPLRP